MKLWICTASLLLAISCAKEPTAPAPPATTATTTTTAATTPTPAPEPPKTVGCVSAPQRLCPVDEGTRDPSFVAFRGALAEAVREKNDAKLLELLDTNVRTSFGGGGGIEEFRSRPELWSELATVLDMGGAFREQMFWAPYVYATWPDEVDAFQHVAAIRAGVPVRAEASADANVVTTVDWAILRLVENRQGDWMHVKTPDGPEGWVTKSDVRSPIGYRAGFSKRSGSWKLEALVAGD